LDKNTAVILISSLLERIERDPTIGTVSSLERKALQIALAALQGEGHSVTREAIEQAGPISFLQGGNGAAVSAATSLPPSPESVDADAKHTSTLSAPAMPTVALDLESIERDEVTDPDVLLCLDFGTAMSKAFATVFPDKHLDLELGIEAGRRGYTLPSSVFIADDGKAYFGFEAIEQSQDLIDSGRERLDSIKSWLSLRREGNLDGEACMLNPAMNPTAYRLTEGDLIRIYLAYLTDIAESSLANQFVVYEPRYAKRRFARPCWPDPEQTKWADGLMRRMLAEAQILADTFRRRWGGGIPVGELKSAVEQVKALDKWPEYLIDDGVPEPVAVAAGALADSENARDAFMVVDAGAGTTDFGLFIATHRPDQDDFRVFQVPASIQGLMQAGDKVDGLLRGFIAQRERIDLTDIHGRMILADLSRRIRGLKETLFKTGKLEYVLADGTVGEVALDEFLADEKVQRFAQAVEVGFKKSLEAVDESWLRWLAMDGVRLNVFLTGGSSALPMMQALAKGPVDVKGYRILRQAVDPRPDWMADMPVELETVYPQLAVAIGGAAETMPETRTAPPVFGGGGPRRHSYVASNLRITGS
jgi:molecular chaperone HscA